MQPDRTPPKRLLSDEIGHAAPATVEDYTRAGARVLIATLPASGIERHQAKVDFLVGWLTEMRFPFDWSYRDALPSWLRDELAVRYSALDGVPVGEMDWALRQAQGWDDDNSPSGIAP